MDPNLDKLEEVTQPARGTWSPWLGRLVAGFEQAMQPSQTAPPEQDTAWHDQMVQKANQSFAQQAAQPAPQSTMSPEEQAQARAALRKKFKSMTPAARAGQ